MTTGTDYNHSLNDRREHLEAVQAAIDKLKKNKNQIQELIILYSLSDEVYANNIYHSAVGNSCTHLGMVDLLKDSIKKRIRSNKNLEAGE